MYESPSLIPRPSSPPPNSIVILEGWKAWGGGLVSTADCNKKSAPVQVLTLIPSHVLAMMPLFLQAYCIRGAYDKNWNV